MNREAIINEVASKTLVSKRKVNTILNLFLSEITGALTRNERVEIRQFGSFEVKLRKARVARDLFSNVGIVLGERPMPHFVPFNKLKTTVSGKLTAPAGPLAKDSEASKPAKARNSRDITSMLSRAQTLARKGLYEKTIQQYQQILNLNPNHLVALSNLGEMFFKIGAF